MLVCMRAERSEVRLTGAHALTAAAQHFATCGSAASFALRLFNATVDDDVASMRTSSSAFLKPEDFSACCPSHVNREIRFASLKHGIAHRAWSMHAPVPVRLTVCKYHNP